MLAAWCRSDAGVIDRPPILSRAVSSMFRCWYDGTISHERPKQRKGRCAAEQRDELPPLHVGPPPPESALSLPQGGRRVLWGDLNCSEWRWLCRELPIPQFRGARHRTASP